MGRSSFEVDGRLGGRSVPNKNGYMVRRATIAPSPSRKMDMALTKENLTLRHIPAEVRSDPLGAAVNGGGLPSSTVSLESPCARFRESSKRPGSHESGDGRARKKRRRACKESDMRGNEQTSFVGRVPAPEAGSEALCRNAESTGGVRKRKRTEEEDEEMPKKMNASKRRGEVGRTLCRPGVPALSRNLNLSSMKTTTLHIDAMNASSSCCADAAAAVPGRQLEVTLTREAAMVDAWLTCLEKRRGRVVGLDVEWSPCYVKGTSNPVALLQVSSAKRCLIVQLLHMDHRSQKLVSFFGPSSDFKFTGVGVKDDLKKLSADQNMPPCCEAKVLELGLLAAGVFGRPDVAGWGLKALAKEVCSYEMQKPRKICMSNWACPVLSMEQVRYAALDAWVSHRIWKQLDSMSAC